MCGVCQQVVKKSEPHTKKKDVVIHEECFKKLIKMDCCGEYLQKEEVKHAGLQGAEPAEP